MENIINQILEIDKRAKERLEEAREQSRSILENAAKEREQVHENYLGRISRRLTIVEETEKKHALELMAQIDARRKCVVDGLDAAYAQDHGAWEQEILARLIGR